jgi:hypothetical protein
MSFKVINGKEVELLDELVIPNKRKVLPKLRQNLSNSNSNNNILFADNSGNIHIKIEEIEDVESDKKNIYVRTRQIKRKILDAFGPGMHDEDRYGQEISSDFFKTNIGHGVYLNSKNYN